MSNEMNNPQEPKKKTWLWVLGWIFCFPIPVMVLIWRKKNTWSKPVKIGATVAFWILLFILLGSCGSDQPTETEAPVEEASVEESVAETTQEDVKEVEVANTEPSVEEEVVPSEFEVIVEVSTRWDGNKAVFDIDTNLPDNTELMLSLRSGDYNTDNNFTAQTKVKVKDGKAYDNGFSNKGEKLKGDYDLSVSMSLPKLQDESVRKVIGEHGEYMTGNAVQKSSVGDDNVVSALFAVSIGDEITATPEDDYSNTTFREEDEDTDAAKEEAESIQNQYDTTDEEKAKVQAQIQKYIDDNYTYTKITKVEVNPNLGTDKEDDYIVLVYLTWDQKNKPATSKEMLNLYSSDMAARVYENLPEVQELVIFWTVPYLNNGQAKLSFERTNNGMKYSDTVFDKNFD